MHIPLQAPLEIHRGKKNNPNLDFIIICIAFGRQHILNKSVDISTTIKKHETLCMNWSRYYIGVPFTLAKLRNSDSTAILGSTIST